MSQPAADACLSDEQIAELAEGLLAPEDIGRVESHLVECVACRVLVAQAARSASSEGVASAPEPREVFALRRIDTQSYEVGREIARGGMGRIMEAWDRNHMRRVAIKVLLKKGRAAAQRFMREVRITSRLQHPAIIPLYEAGVWPDGEPFFSMRFVEGRSLGETVAEATTLPERLALLPHAIAVTEALAYAHDRGVVHRDLKPSNVLVGAFGETVVIDWGLAKELDGGDAADAEAPGDGDGDGDVTVAGRALGTPCYMAPEQARGEVVDARADVYALGALLYHVLAGEAPFVGSSSEQVLSLVLAGPPAPLAARAPNLAPDLLAIVTKAMARDPADRYATAKAMAEDLTRFARGQLVSAHRYSLGTLVGRWVRRHRAVVGVAAVLLVALAVTATWSVRRVLRERDRADQLKVVAEGKERSAVARRDAAENLVEFMVTDLRARLDAVGKLDLLVGVGDEVEKYYGSVSSLDDADNPASLSHHATALEVLADVDRSKEEYKAARAKLDLAIQLRERELTVTADDREAKVALVEDVLGLVSAANQLSEHDEALVLAKRAVNLSDALVADDPKNRKLELLDIKARQALASQPGIGDPATTIAASRAVCVSLQSLSDSEPDVADTLRRLGMCYVKLGQAELNEGGDPRGALETERRAYAALDELAAVLPGDAKTLMQRSMAVQLIGGAERYLGDYEAALEDYRRCVATRVELAAKDPDNADWQRLLGYCVGGEAWVLTDLGQLSDARKDAERVVQIDAAVVAKHPDNGLARRDGMMAVQGLCDVAEAQGHWQEVLDAAGPELASAQALRARDPQGDQWRIIEVTLELFMAHADFELGRLDAALAKARAAEEMAGVLMIGEPDGLHLAKRADARATIGDVLARRGELLLARQALEGATQDLDEVARRAGFGAEWLPLAPDAARAFAKVAVALGDRPAARDRLSTTLAGLEKLDADHRLPPRRRPALDGVRADLAALDHGG